MNRMFHQTKLRWSSVPPKSRHSSMSMAPDPLSQLHVFRHDGHPFGVDSAEVGVLKEADNVSLHPLLQGRERGNLDAEGVGVLLHKTPGQSLDRE